VGQLNRRALADGTAKPIYSGSMNWTQCGGDKSSQDKDIKKAKRIAAGL
jgi:putative component of toxin-antitoxin plasmid stabilization module